MPTKTLSDWEHIAQTICESDPYGHLRSIHNCIHFYDHNCPWVTHCSIQRQDLCKSAEPVAVHKTGWMVIGTGSCHAGYYNVTALSGQAS